MYNAIAIDGPNAIRSFSSCVPEPGWNFYQLGDPDYYEHLAYWLGLLKARDLTAIITLQPYGAEISDDDARRLIRACLPYSPNIIFEAINEPRNNERQKQLVEILKSEGVENKFIQIEWADEGAFFDLMENTLQGEGLATLHWCGTMATINAPHPQGWATSEGCLYLVTIGLYPSSDGSTDGHGPDFPWAFNRTPTPEEAKAVLAWSLNHHNDFTGAIEHGRGFEMLSAQGFAWIDPGTGQRGKFPRLEDVIEFGKAERQAMAI